MKEKIISGSLDLFIRYGIRSVTMDDIAKHLGISKKTIYQFFKDKKDLVMQSSRSYFEKQQDDIDQIENNAQNALEYLYSITVCMRDKMKNMNHAALYDLQRHYPEAWQEYANFKHKRVFDQVVRFINQGIKEGLFRTEIKPDIMAKLRLEEIEMSFDPTKFPLDQYSVNEIHEQLFLHFIYGLLTEKGFELLKKYQQQV